MRAEFIDWEGELSFLEEKYGSDDFELVLIYGRRRVGKTELIKEFIEDRSSIYCLASLEDKEKQLENVTSKIHKHFGGIKPDIQRWTDLFRYFSEKAEEKIVR